MKKRLFVFMVCMLSVLLAACGKNASGSGGETDRSEASTTPAGYESMLLGDEAKQWSELHREVVTASPSAYENMEICSIYRDGEWIKALYNEEKGLVIAHDYARGMYDIYCGDECVSVEMEDNTFGDTRGVIINFRDIENDGEEELFITGGGSGGSKHYLYAVKLSPLSVVNPSFTVDEVCEKFLSEYRIDAENGGVSEFELPCDDGTSIRVAVQAGSEAGVTFADYADYKKADLKTYFSFVFVEENQTAAEVLEQITTYTGRGGLISVPLVYNADTNSYELGDVLEVSWNDDGEHELQLSAEKID